MAEVDVFEDFNTLPANERDHREFLGIVPKRIGACSVKAFPSGGASEASPPIAAAAMVEVKKPGRAVAEGMRLGFSALNNFRLDSYRVPPVPKLVDNV